jgi:peptide/nickel transport system permease protein
MTELTTTRPERLAAAPQSIWRMPKVLLRALSRDPATFLSVLVILLIVFLALAAEVLPIADPDDQDLRQRNKPPTTTVVQPGQLPHLLGTDQLGRDVLSRLIYGSRISLSVGLLGVVVSGTLGVILGLLAGHYRGKVDDLVMRLVDLQMGFPSLLLALYILYVSGPGVSKVILVLAITRWMVYARLTRSLMLSLREEDFVQAARVIGCDSGRIIGRHMLPNLMSPLLVIATLEIATMILVEASLDFLGLGIQPPQTSWGLMLSQGRAYLTSAWWLVVFPGLTILVTTLAFNLLAGWVREITDPVQRWRWLGQRSEARV